MELDFSQFHPLDHRITDPLCKACYGGRKNHFMLAWEYKYKASLRMKTLCRLNIHNPGHGWSRDRGEHTLCVYCMRSLD